MWSLSLQIFSNIDGGQFPVSDVTYKFLGPDAAVQQKQDVSFEQRKF